MFTIAVNNSLITHCESILETHSFGHRHTANGTKEQQLTGIIGQSVIMQLFGLGLIDGDAGFDNGIDLTVNNKTIDVKTMGRTTDVKPSYTNNFLKLQDYFTPDLYVFCSYHKKKEEVTVCGWVTKAQFTEKRRFYPKGSIRTRHDKTTFKTFSDLYEIDNRDLNDVKNFDDLKQQLLAL